MFPCLTGLHIAHFQFFKLFLRLLFHVVLTTSCFAATNCTPQVSQCCILKALYKSPGEHSWTLWMTNPTQSTFYRQQRIVPSSSLGVSPLTPTDSDSLGYLFFTSGRILSLSFNVLNCHVLGRCFPLQQMFSILVSFIQCINIVPTMSQVLCSVLWEKHDYTYF